MVFSLESLSGLILLNGLLKLHTQPCKGRPSVWAWSNMSDSVGVKLAVKEKMSVTMELLCVECCI